MRKENKANKWESLEPESGGWWLLDPKKVRSFFNHFYDSTNVSKWVFGYLIFMPSQLSNFAPSPLEASLNVPFEWKSFCPCRAVCTKTPTAPITTVEKLTWKPKIELKYCEIMEEKFHKNGMYIETFIKGMNRISLDCFAIQRWRIMETGKKHICCEDWKDEMPEFPLIF